MKHYIVVAAIIMNDNKVLCMQRKESMYEYTSLKYEFPGGKVEEGETLQQALAREINEELDLPIQIQDQFISVYHEYPHFKLTMHSFLCTSSLSEPQLKEHVDFKWLPRDELIGLDWAAADLPIVKKLIEL
jgi:8-oxo-dGTP diphosphatase